MKDNEIKQAKKNDRILKWVTENHEKNPELKIELRADELYVLIKHACYEQYQADCRKFNEELKDMFGAGEREKETPKA